MNTVKLTYVGDRECGDNVVFFNWAPGETKDVPADKADRLLTNPHFRKAVPKPAVVSAAPRVQAFSPHSKITGSGE